MRERGGGRQGRRGGLGRRGGDEGGGREMGSREEEVKRTTPGRGSEASPSKIYTFSPPLSKQLSRKYSFPPASSS